jgi:proline dehydrogenase
MANPNNERKELERLSQLDRQKEEAKAMIKISMTPKEIREQAIEYEYQFAIENPDYIRDYISAYFKNDTDDEILEFYVDTVFNWEEFKHGTNE